MGTGSASHKAGPAMEKSFDPVFSYGERKIYSIFFRILAEQGREAWEC